MLKVNTVDSDPILLRQAPAAGIIVFGRKQTIVPHYPRFVKNAIHVCSTPLQCVTLQP